MPLVRTILHRLTLALALAGMLAGQFAAQCEADEDAAEPGLACMDFCSLTGSGGPLVQPVLAPSANAPACDCIHAVAPKTTACRTADRPASKHLQATTGQTMAASPPPVLCCEPIPLNDLVPALSLDMLRTTIIQS